MPLEFCDVLDVPFSGLQVTGNAFGDVDTQSSVLLISAKAG